MNMIINLICIAAVVILIRMLRDANKRTKAALESFHRLDKICEDYKKLLAETRGYWEESIKTASDSHKIADIAIAQRDAAVNKLNAIKTRLQ